MDSLPNIFTKEVFRPTVSLLLPGAIFSYVSYRALTELHPTLGEVTGATTTSKFISIFAASLFFGMIFEEFGSRIESLFDKYCKNSEVAKKDWHRYLQLQFEVEPVGHRYLRSILTRMKFELASSCSLLLSIPGIWPAYGGSAGTTFCWIASACFGWLAIYLYAEAKSSHQILCDIRRTIIEDIDSERDRRMATQAAAKDAQTEKPSIGSGTNDSIRRSEDADLVVRG